MSTSLSYATFFVDQFYFGIPSQDVVELTNGTEITQVPLAPASVCGLINLRGQIVTAIDMRSRLGMASRSPPDKALTVFVSNKGLMFGLVIDRSSDILELDPSLMEKTPSHMPAAAAEIMVGFHKLSDKLLFMLDLEKLIYGCIE